MNRRSFLGAALAFLAGAVLGRAVSHHQPHSYPTWKPNVVPSGQDAYRCVFRTYWKLKTVRPDQLPGL